MIKKIAVVLILLAQATLGYAQVSPEEHAQHHPEENATATDAPAAAVDSGGGMMGGKGGMMGGADGGKGMGGMMEKMGAPKPKDMYPSLMALPNLPMEERAELKQEAHQRMQTGASLMSEGMGALSASAPTDDFIAMQGAVSQIKQGLSQFDSGLAAHRALAEDKAPRNVALQWFKQEMGLLPAGQAAQQRLWFGLSPFHFFVMAMLVLFFGAMSAMYFFKMRRAAALLKQMASVQPISTTEAATPSATSASAPNVAPAAKSKRWSGMLLLINTFQETPTVRTFRFAQENGVEIPFDYLPGQFLTVTVIIDGKKVKRSYTIASSPSQRDYIEITVKREEKGMVSRHLHDHLKIGASLEISGPAGKFTFTGSEKESIVLIAGGVGVTPMMSVLRYLTAHCWKKEIYFIFGVRTPEDIIFREELAYLEKRHTNLKVWITVSQPESSDWDGPTGRLSVESLNQAVPKIQQRLVHVCGPGPMMDGTKQLLLDMGVPKDQIKMEAFGPPPKKDKPVTPAEAELSREQGKADEPSVEFTLSEKAVPISADQTVLEAAEDNDIEIDNSCRTGSCGACKVKMLTGEVEMDVEDALEEDEKASGVILACQAKAKSDLKIEA